MPKPLGVNQNRASLPGGLLETGEAVLQHLHFREREQERQRGLGALVLAQPVHVQTIAEGPALFK